MLHVTKGTKLYIGGVLAQKSADFVASDFTSQSSNWVEVASVEALGTVGDASTAVTAQIVGEGREKTFKGTRNAGTMEIVCFLNGLDTGQIAMIAAEKTPEDYAFKLVLPDAPTGGTASQRLFIGKVMTANEVFDQANNMTKQGFSIAINSNVVKVAADD